VFLSGGAPALSRRSLGQARPGEYRSVPARDRRVFVDGPAPMNCQAVRAGPQVSSRAAAQGPSPPVRTPAAVPAEAGAARIGAVPAACRAPSRIVIVLKVGADSRNVVRICQ